LLSIGVGAARRPQHRVLVIAAASVGLLALVAATAALWLVLSVDGQGVDLVLGLPYGIVVADVMGLALVVLALRAHADLRTHRSQRPHLLRATVATCASTVALLLLLLR
jgi:hypothetical protein